MSDFSDSMDFSPSRQLQLSAFEKLRDTVTGIPALHQSLDEKESLPSPSPRNSYTELYLMKASSQVMTKKKRKCLKLFFKSNFVQSVLKAYFQPPIRMLTSIEDVSFLPIGPPHQKPCLHPPTKVETP
ncbi:hypothetical protein TNCV_4922561 [Trichonephila clavipes]|nr:hypothetical protein TNCV_4922561 [Trichonephila clavipes]